MFDFISWVFSGFTGFCWVSFGFLLSFDKFYYIQLFSKFSFGLLGFTVFSRGSTEYYWASSNMTEYN